VEQHVGEAFLSVYNWATGTKLRVDRSGKPPEPDVLCRDERTGQEIGIEVVGAYYGEDHAKAAWGTGRGAQTEGYQLTRPDWEENKRVLDWVLQSIHDKAGKRYTVSGRLLLVVFTHPARLYLAQEEERLEELRIPTRHPFDEIHVFSQHGELYQLFPERQWILR